MLKIPLHILLVDDEKDFVEMLSLRLRDEEHKVIEAYSGEQALSILEKNSIDVVILDIRMPGMDGITALRAIKNKQPLVEVVLLTGHGAIDTAVQGMKLGAFDYLLKPANFADLLKKLEGAGQRKSEHNERIRQAEAKALVRQTGGM